MQEWKARGGSENVDTAPHMNNNTKVTQPRSLPKDTGKEQLSDKEWLNVQHKLAARNTMRTQPPYLNKTNGFSPLSPATIKP